MAAEVTQQVFLTYWNDPEQFEPARGPLHALLVSKAYQMAHDRTTTSSTPRSQVDKIQTEGIVESEQPAGIVERQAFEAQEALGRLPTECRLAIEAVIHGKCTYQEAAVVLGIPEDAAKARIRRGMAQLRVEMARLSQQVKPELDARSGPRWLLG
jgi:RNA polymerase sigma-70 factor (ECF subfamily)